MNPAKSRAISRRRFVKSATGLSVSALAAPYIVPARVLSEQAPSNTLTMGLIGCGWVSHRNVGEVLQENDARIRAVCDLDDSRAVQARDRINQKYGNKDCETFSDFQELIARDDIDTILLCTPDHWHAIPAIMAAEAGKDIYGEKPITHSHEEGVKLVETIKRHGTVWQTGSWQRSFPHFRHAAELVRNGRVGKIHTVEVGLPGGIRDELSQYIEGPPPKNIRYDRWVGPAPWHPYQPNRHHKNWRWHMDYGGSQLMDWIGHHNDIAHWGLGSDDTIGPTRVEATGEWIINDVQNYIHKYLITCDYPDDITVKIGSPHYYPMGAKWIGTDGWVHVSRGGIKVSENALLGETFGPGEIHLTRSPGHFRNFFDCVKSRKTTLTPAAVAHRSTTPGHLGIIAMRLGRAIRWDTTSETIVNDPTASRMLGRSYRSPWTL